ncbi:hypothetical protein M426DRAFT_258962 [Hypoxylon sp. CI-4A]|nr:hypothetical protein M426DRAFT_258962 [Hypoxylon sp. CI-4A]
MSEQKLPSSQQAVVQDSSGRPTLTHDAALPPLLPGTILIRTVAVALNPSDTKMGPNFPSPGAIVGFDFAGEVVRMHTQVSELRPDLKVGDRVCGLVHGSNPADRGNGAFAEYVRVPALLVLKVPEYMEMRQAAALGVAIATNALTLWESLGIPGSPYEPAAQRFDVLVYGGSTCMGTMATQLLKLSGARVITTCSNKNIPLAKRYGADSTLDYLAPGNPENIRHLTGNRLRYALDCVVDKDSVECCYAALGRSGGRYTCLELCPEELRTRKAVKAEFIMVLDIFGKGVQLDRGYEREPNISPHPIEVMDGGFQGILDGLQRLRTGSISGKKLVVYLGAEDDRFRHKY